MQSLVIVGASGICRFIGEICDTVRIDLQTPIAVVRNRSNQFGDIRVRPVSLQIHRHDSHSSNWLAKFIAIPRGAIVGDALSRACLHSIIASMALLLHAESLAAGKSRLESA